MAAYKETYIPDRMIDGFGQSAGRRARRTDASGRSPVKGFDLVAGCFTRVRSSVTSG
jgi:hypothetical protein